MNYLLDTHALVWALREPGRLGKRARHALGDRKQEVFASAASAWEIALKVGYGKIRFPLDNLPEALVEAGFLELPITVAHALGVKELPLHHRDPFDRLLIAQALAEDLVLITKDEALAAYEIQTLWD